MEHSDQNRQIDSLQWFEKIQNLSEKPFKDLK